MRDAAINTVYFGNCVFVLVFVFVVFTDYDEEAEELVGRVA